MARFTVSVTDEQNEWVERKAEEINGSKSQVICMLIDLAGKGNMQPMETVCDGSPVTVLEKIDELEQRIESLES